MIYVFSGLVSNSLTINELRIHLFFQVGFQRQFLRNASLVLTIFFLIIHLQLNIKLISWPDSMQSNSTYFPTFFENFTLIKSLAWSKLCQRDYNPYLFVQYQVFHKIPPIATLTVIWLPLFQRIFQQLRYFIFICNFFSCSIFRNEICLSTVFQKRLLREVESNWSINERICPCWK